jgi:ABC-type amino acid transport system permease subunit
VTVSGYDVSLFLHITAIVIGLGSTFAEGLTFPVAMRLDPRHLPYKHRLQLAVHRFLTLPALVVVLATGFYQVAELDSHLGEFWLSGALAIVIVLAGLIGAYFIPEDRRLEAMVKRDIAASGGGAVSLSDEL